MDCLIKDALVVDGTGAPPRVADIGVVDGRIAAVGPGLGMAARQVVDARGLMATPGLFSANRPPRQPGCWTLLVHRPASPSKWHALVAG